MSETVPEQLPLNERLRILAEYYDLILDDQRFARALNGGKPRDDESEAIGFKVFPEYDHVIDLLREAAASLAHPDVENERLRRLVNDLRSGIYYDPSKLTQRGLLRAVSAGLRCYVSHHGVEPFNIGSATKRIAAEVKAWSQKGQYGHAQAAEHLKQESPRAGGAQEAAAEDEDVFAAHVEAPLTLWPLIHEIERAAWARQWSWITKARRAMEDATGTIRPSMGSPAQALAEHQSVDAVDPSAADPGKPSTREEKSS